MEENALTEKIIGVAIEVHRHLGPGLLESAYEECLCYELSQAGLNFQRQVHTPIYYKGIKLEAAYRMDLVVEDKVVVGVKAVEAIADAHSAQLLTYLKSSGKKVGLIVNFNLPVLKDGIKRIISSSSSSLRNPPRLCVSASKNSPPPPTTQEPQ